VIKFRSTTLDYFSGLYGQALYPQLSLYCNALDEPLLCQCTTMTPDHRLFLRRAVGLDFGQVDGRDTPDPFGGGS